jgi:hypothetical protein
VTAAAIMRLCCPAAVALFAACSGASGTDDMQAADAQATGTLALGTVDVARYGDQRWVDLTDGQQVTLVPGAQGGFHVWVLYRTQGISGRVQVSRIADRVPADGSARQRVLTTTGVLTIPSSDPWQTPDPIPSFMCPTPIGVSVLDAPIELSVRISPESDASTTLAQSTVRILEQCPPVTDSTHDFCLKICQG